MESKEFSKDLISGLNVVQKGEILQINGATSFPSKVDYSDSNQVVIVATCAVNTANGYYDLIKRNCNTLNPDVSKEAHFEMYLALAGLTCEIYMKSIIYFESKHSGRKYTGHKLYEIFQDVPKAIQDTIKRKIMDVDTVLPNIGDVFEKLRYEFELTHINGDYLVIFDLMEELKKICNDYPKSKIGELRFANGILCLE